MWRKGGGRDLALALAMNSPTCPKCEMEQNPRSVIRRLGFYFRTSDQRTIRRYRCWGCRKSFSEATFEDCYRQKKRHLNEPLRIALASHSTQRRAARTFHLARKTVSRKAFLGSLYAEERLGQGNLEQAKAREIEFDDLETFEHSRCKPLSITLAVESKTRRILGLEVSVMPAKGHLAQKATSRYGYRPDLRREGRRRLFQRIRHLVDEHAIIKSDSNPHYGSDVKEFFPNAKHVLFKGRRGSNTGQGELKRGGFDPLFSLNHTCAMFRANVCRLIRKTWNTTKSADHLYAHLLIYAEYHNHTLLKPGPGKAKTHATLK